MAHGRRLRCGSYPGLARRKSDSRSNITDLADWEQRIVATKDADFVDSHILQGRPAKLRLISTGNVSNRELESLLVPLIPDLVREFQVHSFVELGRMGIVARG